MLITLRAYRVKGKKGLTKQEKCENSVTVRKERKVYRMNLVGVSVLGEFCSSTYILG